MSAKQALYPKCGTRNVTFSAVEIQRAPPFPAAYVSSNEKLRRSSVYVVLGNIFNAAAPQFPEDYYAGSVF